MRDKITRFFFSHNLYGARVLTNLCTREHCPWYPLGTDMTAMKSPNLLFIFSDQHSAAVAGCYGDKFVSTPNLDRLAAQGVVFDNAYCTSPLCTPSRMSMITAKHPHNVKVWGNNDILRSGTPTMGHALGAAGYDACLVGRLHSVGPDQLLGYSDRLVGDHHPNWVGVPRLNMGPLQGAASPDRRSLIQSGPGLSSYEVKDGDVTEATLQRLDQISAEMESGDRTKFAMTVGYMLPHAPFVTSKEKIEKYLKLVGLARQRPPEDADEHSWINRWRHYRNITDVTEEEELRARAAYYALVESLDEMIGRVLDKLEDCGLADNTLVVYSSDHGEQIGERGLWWKHTFFDESVRVPLIMRWPGVLPEGERREQVISLVDVTATMLDSMNAPEIPEADGKSFLGVAKDANAPWRNVAFSEYCYGSQFDWGLETPGQIRMVRKDNFKLVYYSDAPAQLFDLDSDPDEARDLSDQEAYAEKKSELLDLIFAVWNPETVGQIIEDSIPAKKLLADWAGNTNPESGYMWEMKPEYNKLF